MKQQQVWNIADVTPEAREQARAAAQKEGISVGDWLQRRLLDERSRDRAAAKTLDTPAPRTVSLRAGDDAETAARAEESAPEPVAGETRDNAAGRIEGAVRAMTRLLDANERSQSEANRALGNLTSEINVAAREQASAYQVLNERIDRLERETDTSALRDTVRDLGQGLSQLADRAADDVTEARAQIEALANTVETLGAKFVLARDDLKRLDQSSQEALGALAERLHSAETCLTRYPQVEDKVEALAKRLEGMDEIENSLADLRKYNSEASAEIHTLAGGLEALGADIDSACKETECLDQRLRSAEERMASYPRVEQAVEALNARVAGLDRIEKSVVELGARNNGAAVRIDDLAHNLEVLADDILSAHAESKRLELEIGEGLRAFGERLRSAESLTATYPEMTETVERLSLRIAGLDRIEQAVVDLEKRDAEASATMTELGIALQTLGRTIVSMREDSNKLAERVRSAESLTATYAQVEGSVATLIARSAQLGELEKAVKESGERDAQAKREITALAGRFETLESDFASAREESGQLAERLRLTEASVSSALENGEAIDGLRGRVASLEQTAKDDGGQLLATLERKLDGIAARVEQGEHRLSEEDEGAQQNMSRLEQMLIDATNSNRELLSELRTSLGELTGRVASLEERGSGVAQTVQPKVPPAPQAAEATAPSTPPAAGPDYLAQARRAALTATVPSAQEGAASKPSRAGMAALVGYGKRRSRLRAAAAIAVALSLIAGGYLLMPRATPQTAKVATKPSNSEKASSPKPKSNSGIDQELARANAGDAKAMLALATAYADGAGVAQNGGEAAAWLERAARAGEPEAQFRLAKSYENGTGVAADPNQALYWYAESANHGNPKAMYNLGVAYAGGSGTAKNLGEAARWFRSAAELGMKDAQFNLGVMYERGLGLQASPAEAYKWYAIGAAGGDADLKVRAEALAKQLTASQRDAADQFAAAFKPEAVKPETNEVAPVVAPAEQ